jgi:ELWxxDGT repeat protein
MNRLSAFLLLFLSTGIAAQQFNLVKEINTIANGNSISSSLMARVGSTVYFVANDGNTGGELWKTDGTEQGTTLVKDITAGTGSTSFSLMTAGNGLVFFVANDGVSGSELWRSDGTEAGTYLLKDINPGSASAAINRIFFHNGLLFFGANNGTHGQELWKSDGTTAGTVMIKDINPGATASSPAPLSNALYTFVALGNEVFFAAAGPSVGRELYKTDGTEAGTVLVKDVWPGGTSGIGITNHKAAVHNGRLYFAGNDGVNGVELWSTDGTEAGTFMVKDIVAGSGHSHPNNLISFNGALFFSASTVNNGNPNLYKTDGTEAGTVLIRDLVADGTILNIGNTTAINDFTIAAGKLFFRSGSSLNGLELFVSDGTTGGTGLVKDIVPGINGSGPNGLMEMNGKLYFSAFDLSLQKTILFSSDGTEAGTMGNFEGELRDVLSVSSVPFIGTGSKFFFLGSTQDGIELWSTDGTSAGTAMVRNINTTITGTPNFNTSPQSSIEMNGYSYFAAGSPDHGMELWKSNGTTVGTAMVKDIWPGKGPSSPLNLFKHGGYIYFSANDGTHGTELWRTDGTEAGTVMIKDINPGNAGSNLARFALSNNYLYFTAYTVSDGQELWRTDGTEAGTVLALDLVSGPVSGMTGIAEGITLNDEAYLIAVIGAGNSLGITNGTKLIRVNGATNTISELSSIISFAQDITLSGNTLYIGGRNAANQTILWKSVNGGAVEQVKLLSNTAVTVFQLTDCGGKLYFSASDSSSGLEPWVSDGTEAGTFMLKDINPGSGTSNPNQYVFFGGKVFFTASSFIGTGVNNSEIYITDGTVAGTYLFKDIQPGAQGSRPSGGAMIEYPANKLLFTANDGVSGTELWQSDGTSEGTTLLQDFNSGSGDGFNFPGIPINFPTEHVLNRVGDGLIFFARNAVTGFQLYGGSLAATYYVNDNSQTGDVFTTAVGSDANPGTAAAPFATLAYAVSQAKNGDTIYVDAGTYNSSSQLTINKSITLLGSNYLISPNDATTKTSYNGSRNAETRITGAPIIIAADYIRLIGLRFSPTSSAISQNGNFSHSKIEKNYFDVIGTGNIINLQGSASNPIVAFDFAITDNRFERTDLLTGRSINLGLVKSVWIDNNVFIEAPASGNPYRGFALRTEFNQKVETTVFSNNYVKKLQVGVLPTMIQDWTIMNNVFDSCTTGINHTPSNMVSTNVFIRSNTFTNMRVGRSILVRSGVNGGVDNYNIIDNTHNQEVDGINGIVGMMQLDFPPTSTNGTVNVTGNKLNLGGDYNNTSINTNCGIFIGGKHGNTTISYNELNFSAVNFRYNGFGILPNMPTGIYINTDNFGFGGPIPSNAVVTINNNKINGFKNSVGLYDPVAGSNGNTGYGYLITGATVSVNNNHFSNDSMSVDNGTVGQDINANCNWYGSAAAQDIINKISLNSADVVPWLTNGTDNDVATGFQPVPGACDGYPTLITLDNYTDVTCNGANNGSINITTSYGKTPFTYTWTKEEDANFISHDEDLTNLSPGTYHLSIVDGNGSNIYITDPEADGPGTITVTITEPDVLTATASGSDNICFNGAIGSASVLASGGTAPYTYLWSNGATTDEISNLTAGVYNVTVTDANGCTATASYQVTQPTQLTASITNSSTACSNIATVNAGGGTPGYTYLWSNGSQSATISGVPVGTYNVTVTDANGCTATASINLTVAEAFNPSASVTNITCFGANNGVITVTNANGTAPFTFSIDGINFVPGTLPYSFTGLAAGTYTVAVRDVNGCTGFVSRTVSQPTPLLVTLNNVQSSCFGQNNGSISASVSGGSPAYSYQWTGPNGYSSTQLSISNLAAGNYSLTVTDNKSCTVVLPVTVPSFSQITTNPVIQHVSCKNGNNGSIILNTSGGTGNFSYSWNTGQSTGSIFNLVKNNNYKVTITDIGSGCTLVQTFEITEPATLVSVTTPNQDIVNVSGCVSLGSFRAVGSGGTPFPNPDLYRYSIDGINFQASQVFSNLNAGAYTVTVMDMNGCRATRSVTISDNGSDEYESVPNNPGNNNNNNKGKAAPISQGTPVTARIGTSGDVDYYKLAPSNTWVGNYTVNFSQPPVAVAYHLTQSNGTTVITASDSSATHKQYDGLNGTYYIRVSGANSLSCYQFTVNNTVVTRSSGTVLQQEVSKATIGKDVFDVKVLGNPSSSAFTLEVISGSEEELTMRVTDLHGRLIEIRQKLQPLQLIRIGDKLRAGVYFAEIIQGRNRKTVKLIKM